MRGKDWPALAGVVLLALSAAGARAGEPAHGFLDRLHRDADGKEAKYVLFVPHDYTGARPYPLILFLHGIGECGSDGHRQVQVGLGPAVRQREKTFPFFVLFPQSQRFNWQAGSADARRALDMVAEVARDYRIDPRRIYLTGISLGGHGTWSLAARYPDRWAAIVPICGWGEPSKAAILKDLPCWCFHGALDWVVSVDRSRRMIEALRAAGGRPRYTEYPEAGHNCWNRAYNTPELYDWLLAHHR